MTHCYLIYNTWLHNSPRSSLSHFSFTAGRKAELQAGLFYNDRHAAYIFFIVLLKYKRPSLKKTYLFFVALIHVHIFQRGWCLYRCAVSTFAFLFVLDGSLLFNSKCSISISVQTFHVFCVLLRIKYDFMRFSKSPDFWNLFV